MKKFFLLITMFTAFGFWTKAQTIEDFESITMNLFSAGTNGMLSVVANPDTVGNHSLYVGKMVRGFDGDPWAGWWAVLPTPIDLTANPYVHIKVWKPRISPVVFKVEEGAGNSGDVNPMNPQALTGQWEELVYDMSATPATGEYVKIVFIPDFEDPLTLTEDITLYFDDLYVNNDPTVGSAPVQVMENFETIPLNYMLGGAEDMSYMELIPNPDPSGINTSAHVIHFMRDKDGVPWGGFWSTTVVDVTEYKYMHVKVWKPRVSPVKFKIEGGDAGNLEAGSIYPQDSVNAWQDMVFDFSSKTGTYPIIALMPDFIDPVGLDADIDIYFDDIILNNDPTPIGGGGETFSVTFNCNMSYQIELGNFDPTADFLDVAGNFNEWSGSDHMETGLQAGIYTITIGGFAADDILEFKFRINGDWATSEFPNGGPNRMYTVVAGTNEILVWYNDEQPIPPSSTVIADFEDDTWGILTPHIMGLGDFDNSELHAFDETFNIINNPDKSGVNTSDKVLEFVRRGTDNGAFAWGGFWATCDPQIDATDSKYVHYMVWKPVMSPVYCKMEGGTAGTLEMESTNPQDQTEKWMDMVFDFSTLTGLYPTFVVMPDFPHPAEDFVRTEDIIIYLDNIIINSDPNPISSIKDNKAEFDVNIYPNPCVNNVQVTLTKDMKDIRIYNVTGQTLFEAKDVSKGTLNIDVSNFSNGIYFITLTDENYNSGTAKLLKN